MRQAVYDALAPLPEPKSGGVWPVGDFRVAFEGAVKAARLTRPLRFHDLRHASLSMTTRYAHLSPDHLGREMSKTERRLGRPARLGKSTVVRWTARR